MALLSAAIEVKGNWGESAPDAGAVLSRARDACLRNVALISDRQPAKILVDEHDDGGVTPPSIWLHQDKADTAWIIVDVSALDWSRLAYQFGHELGHVLCNSWGPDAKSQAPCQWLEEALVEAFSLRGMAVLAQEWATTPPFPNDHAFGVTIDRYRDNQLDQHSKLMGGAAVDPTWFVANRTALEQQTGLSGPTGGAVPTMLQEFEANAQLLGDLGALNRWPERTGVPLEMFLSRWEQSCVEVHAPTLLPRRLRELLGVG